MSGRKESSMRLERERREELRRQQEQELQRLTREKAAREKAEQERKRQEKERKRREKEQKRREEAERKRQEKERQKHLAEERRRQEAERRRKEEEERRRRAEEERRRLEEQHQRELERLQREEERRQLIASLSDSNRKLHEEIRADMQKLLPVLSRCQAFTQSSGDMGSDTQEQAAAVYSEVRQFLQANQAIITGSSDPTQLTLTQAALQMISGRLKGLDQILEQDLRARRRAAGATLLSQIDRLLRQAPSSVPPEPSDLELAGLREILSLLESIADEENTLGLEETAPQIRREYEARRESLRQSLTVDACRQFLNQTVPEFRKKILDFQKEQDEAERAFGSVYPLYAVLCQEAGIQEELFDVSRDGVRRMQEACTRLKAEVMTIRENQEILRLVEETLQELGYPVLAQKTLTAGDGGRLTRILLQYTEDTAVDVTVSADGKVAMEVGLMDNSSRSPDQAETAYLCGEMRYFCKDYAEIEQKLQEKGVVLLDKNYRPPEAAYATVINVSEMDLAVECTEEETRDSAGSLTGDHSGYTAPEQARRGTS